MVSIKYLEDTTKANEDWKQAEKKARVVENAVKDERC